MLGQPVGLSQRLRLLPMAIFNLLDVFRCVDPKDLDTWQTKIFDHLKRLQLQEEAVGVVDYPRPVRTLSTGLGRIDFLIG